MQLNDDNKTFRIASNSQKNMTRKRCAIIPALLSLFSFSDLNQAASARELIRNQDLNFVDKECYVMRSISASYNDQSQLLNGQPWWNNEKLAEEFSESWEYYKYGGYNPNSVNSQTIKLAYASGKDISYKNAPYSAGGGDGASPNTIYNYGTAETCKQVSAEHANANGISTTDQQMIFESWSDLSPNQKKMALICYNGSYLKNCGYSYVQENKAALTPNNVTASGGLATQGFINQLADTVFQSTASTIKPVPTNRSNEAKYDAWAQGFGGSVTPFSTDNNGHNDFYSSHGGVVVGIGGNLNKNFYIGAYGNYGSINLTHYSGLYSDGGSWNPTGFGGGVTARYSNEDYYISAIFGATAFNGTNSRNVNIPGFLNTTYESQKSTTSYLGAARIGAPIKSGDLFIEPQLTAIWNGNNDAAYSENSGNEVRAYGLTVNSSSDNYFQTQLGAKLSWPIRQGKKSMLTPQLRIAWLADWDTGNGAVTYQRTYAVGPNPTINQITSNQESEYGVLLEAGLDYSLYQASTSEWKIYAKGGAHLWANRDPEWRTSGGITFRF